jgi:hypothetical protein
MSGKSLMHGRGESHSGIVPTKQPNKGRRPSEEVAEGRPLTKDNTPQPNPCQTQRRANGARVGPRVDPKHLPIRGKNHVRCRRLHGSVRGAAGNRCPYRDRPAGIATPRIAELRSAPASGSFPSGNRRSHRTEVCASPAFLNFPLRYEQRFW